VWFWTQEQCEAWRGLGPQKLDPAGPHHAYQRVRFPREAGFLDLAEWMALPLAIKDRVALVWITEWGIWPSSENFHLYYRLRQSYGDRRMLHEAPGHYFLNYERADLVSFLQVALLNGWGGYVLIDSANVNFFFSHDEYVDVFCHSASGLDEVRGFLKAYGTGSPAKDCPPV
jgi:hypothetical protein